VKFYNDLTPFSLFTTPELADIKNVITGDPVLTSVIWWTEYNWITSTTSSDFNVEMVIRRKDLPTSSILYQTLNCVNYYTHSTPQPEDITLDIP
jgi:hypothetical protein